MKNILVKIPTRERPDIFMNVLRKYVQTTTHPDFVHYLISVDEDDETMNDPSMATILGQITGPKNLTYIIGRSKNKIDAINRDVESIQGWDILVNGADDMIPIVNGWDEVLREKFTDHFKGVAGCLHFLDGTHRRLCTMAIMNKMAWEERKYIYHPSYISLWCDQEFTDYWNKDHRLLHVQRVLFEHRHPASYAHKKHEMDALYRRNEDRRLWNLDEANYYKRKDEGFPA